MDFARKQLEKYGWTEGKGLGKKEDGISNAIKPKLKFDNAGVGHNLSDEFTNDWWNNVYNNASSNIKVETGNGSISISRKSNESVNITTSKYVARSKHSNSMYNNFVKTEKLLSDNTIVMKDDDEDAKTESINFQKISDDELFAACGGRTAHKGARHGLKLSGKLSRIAKQEKLLLKKLQNVRLDEDESLIKKKMHKLSDNKELQLKHSDEIMLDDYDSRSSTGSITPKKKSKHKKKTVTFKDVVIEYATCEDKSAESQEPSLITTASIHDDSISTNLSTEKSHRKLKDLKRMACEKLQEEEKTLYTATTKYVEIVQHELSLEQENSDTTNIVGINSKKRKHAENEDDNRNIKWPKSSKHKKKERKHKLINKIASNLDKMCNITDK